MLAIFSMKCTSLLDPCQLKKPTSSRKKEEETNVAELQADMALVDLCGKGGLAGAMDLDNDDYLIV
jgi:hypothetical protein